jgi:hypothetical protein
MKEAGMKRVGAVLSLAILAVAVSLAVPALSEHQPGASERISIQLDIAPQAGSADTFICTAVIEDLASGALLSEPRVVFQKAEQATIRTGIQASSDPRSALDVLINVMVDESGSKASYSAEVKRGTVVITSQRASIRLKV